jgi:hypothetical protein
MNLKNNFLRLPFRFKFLITSLIIGLIVITIHVGPYVIEIVELKSLLSKMEDNCKRIPPWKDKIGKDEEVVEITPTCSSVELSQQEFKKIPDSELLIQNEKLNGDLTYIQTKIFNITRRLNFLIPDSIWASEVEFSIFLFLGLIPIFWRFLLNRVSDISKAIRGER